MILEIGRTIDGVMHPAHIHDNTAAEGGPIAISLESVNGTTGVSITRVTETDAGTAITYEGLLGYDGYVNVHLNPDDLTVVAQGDIGQNVFTGNSQTYTLSEKDVAGISGTATFQERLNGTTLVTLDLSGTPAKGIHPTHIHMGSVAESPGDIAISLNEVDGTTGMSSTEVTNFDAGVNNGAAITYAELLQYDGYINVHLSPSQLATIVAQGDIGANAP